MVNDGCQYAVIETTSQGIEQFRHRFINYDILVFTGLYPEHIEAHGGFENYKRAKGKLFAHLERCGFKYADKNKKVVKAKSGMAKIHSEKVKKVIIVNGDDEHAEYFLNHKVDEKISYTSHAIRYTSGDVKYNVGKIEEGVSGISFSVDDVKFNLQLIGGFNVRNTLTAICVGLTQELTLEQIKFGLESIGGVPGRFEHIDEGQSFTVIVDYAFEPRAVEKLYETIKLIPHKRVIHVLGSAGGGRDVARRPVLGKIAGEKADIVIITNEDPYDDDPGIIIDQVAVGAEKSGKKMDENLYKILDRREAIRKALRIAEENDLVLITGKGCEQAICVEGGKRIKWDDRKAVREELKSVKSKK